MSRGNFLSFNERNNYSQYANGQTNQRSRECYKKFLDSALRNNITARQRQILLLHYVNGYSASRTAELLGINKSTVCRSLQSTTQKLQKLAILCKDMLR